MWKSNPLTYPKINIIVDVNFLEINMLVIFPDFFNGHISQY